MKKTNKNTSQTETDKVELEVIPIDDYEKGSEEYMRSFKKQARTYGLDLEFYQPVYPSRTFPMWYSGNIAKLTYSDRISILVISHNSNLKLYAEEDSVFRGVPGVEDAGFFTDSQINNAINFDIIEVNSDDEFYFTIIDKEIPEDEWVGSYDLDLENMNTLEEALNFKQYAEDLIPEYLKNTPPQSKDEKLIKEDKNEVELLQIRKPNYEKGSQEQMSSYVNKAKEAGFKVEFLQNIYPSRDYPLWYSGHLFSVEVAKGIEIVFYSNNDDMIISTSDGGEINSVEELEDLGIYTDEDLSGGIVDDYLNADESAAFIAFNIEDSRSGTYKNTHSSELNYDDFYSVEDTLNEFALFNNILNDYMNTLAESKDTDKKLEEDKATKDLFVKRFGNDIYDRFIKLKPRLKSPQNDISYWMKKTPEELQKVLSEIEQVKTVKQKQEKSREGAQLLYEDKDWLVHEITTLEASIKYGKGTMWCISGTDCDSEKMWKFYLGELPEFPKDNSVFIFFRRKDDRGKWAVLFNKNTKIHIIWNELDNIVGFIKDAPTVKGLPNFREVPTKLKTELAKGIKIPVENIILIREATQELYSDDHLEKYWVTYKDKQGKQVENGFYRSPDDDKFVPFDTII